MATLPFEPESLTPAERAIVAAAQTDRASHGATLGGPYLPLFNHPELARRIEALGSFLKFEGLLPRDVYQVIVLRVARTTGAAFEWVDHVAHAREAGVPREVLNGLLAGTTLAGNSRYADVLAVVDAALAWCDVPADVQARVIASLGTRAFIEIVVLAGFYQMFSAINQGFAVPLPAGIETPFQANRRGRP
jgi:4-carboxymuconolactone decarboxylase